MAAEPEVPDGWKLGVLSEVLESHRGGVWGTDAQEGTGYSVLRSTNMRGGRIDFTNVARCHVSDSVAQACSLIPGDILVSKSSGSPHLVGLSALYRGAPDNGTYLFSNFTMRLRPDRSKINPEYLALFLMSSKAEAERRSMAQDTAGLRNLKTREYLAQVLPLPPLPEQQRLIEKVERLLEQSRTAREALDRIPALLKHFRQTVLAKAFRGELTERDPSDEPASVLLERIREERRRKWEGGLRARDKDPHKATYVEPEPPDTSGLPELPEGWMWTAMGDGIATMKNGIYKPPSFYGEGTPCLRMYNILSGRIVMKDIKLMRLEPSEVDEYGLLPGDVLVNRVNSRELVGKCAVVPGGLGDIVYESKNIRLRVREAVALPEYVMYVVNSRIVRDVVELRAKQTVGMATINQTDIQSWPLPLAPLSEQRRIIAKLELTFGQAEAIEQTVAQSLRRAEQVDQAVLGRAFRGEL